MSGEKNTLKSDQIQAPEVIIKNLPSAPASVLNKLYSLAGHIFWGSKQLDIQQADLADYVLKEAGKGLSENDLTDELKAGYDGAVTNSHEPHSDDQDLSGKVDKVEGKGLSTYDLNDDVMNLIYAGL